MDDVGLMTGLASFGGGFLQGQKDAEDRKYKRMELEAKVKAQDSEKMRQVYEDELKLVLAGKKLPPKGQPIDLRNLENDPQFIENKIKIAEGTAGADPYGNKALAAEIAKAGLLKTTAEIEEKKFKKTPQGRIEGLAGDQRKRFEETTGAFDALRDIKSAFGNLKPGLKGKSEMVDVPLRGDTDFTKSRNQFIEFLGRLQSGGAITKDEAALWTKLLPGVLDNPEIANSKLSDLEFRMQAKLKGYGVSSEEAEELGFLKPRGGLLKSPSKPEVLKTDQIEWAD